MKKAVFFDVDGTLVNTFNGNHEISPVVRQAIYDLKAAGHYVFVATGRPYAFVSKMLWDFGFDGFVLSNGAQVVMNGETIYGDKMDPEFIKAVVRKFDEHHVQYVLEGEHYSYLKEEYQELYDLCGSLNVSMNMIKREYNIDEIETYKIEILCNNEKAEKCCKELIEAYPEYGYYFSISGTLLEIYAKRNHKAKGIEKALEFLNISIEESYAFGDGKNDIEMLETVGCGIAMGNASDEVKNYAKQVTDTVANDGVAVGIYQYILQDEAKEVV